MHAAVVTGSFWALVALAYHVASRLAYVLYIGGALRREERMGYLTRRYGAAEAFRRFRRVTALVMYNDGVSFIVLCLVARNGMAGVSPLGGAVALVGGVALIVVGAGTKLWAAATLGGGAYYWRNFFFPADPVVRNTAGPYRFLRNPMYTVGYLHTYGLALATGSTLGLGAALFDQAAILAFYLLVEQPHFERARRGALDSGAAAAQNVGSPIRSPEL
jgi:protein-S-isoprenylcysteine O-methyltransferase Ste14